MACLQKLSADVLWGCYSGGTQGSTLGVYEEMLFINASDINSFSASNTTSATLVLNSGTRGYIINSVNRSIKVSVGKKGGDLYPVMYDPSIIIKVPSQLFSVPEGSASKMLNSSGVIALKGSNGYTIIGLGAPLVCTEIEGDSTASEFLTVTFGTDEGQTGSTIYGISKATYEALKVPAV